MASICALREFDTEENCKKECEFYKGKGICGEEYNLTFCPYQHFGEGAMDIPESLN